MIVGFLPGGKIPAAVLKYAPMVYKFAKAHMGREQMMMSNQTPDLSALAAKVPQELIDAVK